MKCPKQLELECPFYIIGGSARPMVAFSGFYESHEARLSGNARGIILPHRHGHPNCHQSCYMLPHRFVDCRLGGRRGDTERVVAQWRRPVASDVALVMLYWAMPYVSLQSLRMAIEMALIY